VDIHDTNPTLFSEATLFEATFNQAAVGMAHVSLSGGWLKVNRKLCDIVGYTQAELQKISFQHVTHPDDLRTDLALVEKVLAGEIDTYSLEKRYLKKNGEILWANLTVSLVRDEARRPLFFISVVEDIGHVVAQRRLIENQSKSFFELSRDLMLIMDFDGVLVKVNPALKDLLGFTDDELASRHFIDHVHPEDRARTAALHLELETNVRVSEFENRYVCKDGRMRILSWTATRIEGDQRIYAIARDITDARRLELERHEQKLKIVAGSRMEALGRMAAGMAHEINNPLTVVYGQAILLGKMLNDTNLDRNRAQLMCDRVVSMSARIVDILNGLRTFSRDSTNDALRPHSLEEILTDTLAFCKERLKSTGIHLEVEAIPKGLQILCRPSQISQVLLNLINNAHDAVEDKATRSIYIELVTKPGFAGLAVRDSGGEIPPEQRANLFQPFFTTKEVGKGTGLGLSISKGLIDTHGGEIFLDTAPGPTRFVFLVRVA
jgi:PAS domain S-box-containing protein